MIRTKPNSPVNFDVHEEGIIKLFNEFDRYQQRALGNQATPDERCVYRLSELEPDVAYTPANFQLVTALVQMPHLDVVRELEKRKGAALTEVERRHLDRRMESARLWVAQYASEEEKTRLQEVLPTRASELSAPQRAFLNRLADVLPGVDWNEDSLQAGIFEVARMTPIEQPVAFKAIYRVLLDRESGPKAGNLLAFLDRDFLVKRFRELAVDRLAFWRESAVQPEEFKAWLEKQGDKVAGVTWELVSEGDVFSVEYIVRLGDGRRQLKRILVTGQPVEGFGAGVLAGTAWEVARG
jgi:lysyl-tRNA synthetase class 1